MNLFNRVKLITTITIISLFAINNLYAFVEQNKIESNLQLWVPPQFFNQNTLGYSTSTFSIPRALEKEVQFWIDIYTKYTTVQGVFHRVGDITEVLGSVDLTDIYLNPKWGPIRKEIEGKKIIEQVRKNISMRSGINLKSIRLQMGLKDRMQTAIKLSGQYYDMIENLFEQHKLPIELSRLIFVESSFNTFAESKVGAAGLWQIMPNIGKKLKLIQPQADLRLHPYHSTLAAIKILKENYQILKNWPLAVTSYNFGVGSMLKVKKKLDTTIGAHQFQNTDLVFQKIKDQKLLGFASRNFYATFLAALYVEAHANLYFGDPLFIEKPLNMQKMVLNKKTNVIDFLKENKMSLSDFKVYNPHLKSAIKNSMILNAGLLVYKPENIKSASLDFITE